MTTDDLILDPARLASLRGSGLLEPSLHVDFDRVTSLAARLLEVPVCLVSLVDEDRQVFAGACGLPEPIDEIRETPLSHSFCKHAVIARRPLIIKDARTDPLVSDNGAVSDMGVISYLGFPIFGPDHHVLGSFCVIDTKPRNWSDEEIGLVRDMTALVVEQIELHITKQTARSSLDVLIHDLKSPLAGISMVTNILTERENEMPAPLRPLVEALAESTSKALDLVESLAHRDRDKNSVCPDFGSVLADLLCHHRTIAERKGLNLEYRDDGKKHSVAVAEWVIEQVAENLLANAIKFTPQGGSVFLTVGADGGGAYFNVSDTGPGFQKEDYPKLFRRYTKMSARPTGGEPSTGLGLSIVKRLVEQEGGTVDLVSQPGEGANFRVSFALTH